MTDTITLPSTELAEPTNGGELAVITHSEASLMMNPAVFEHMQRVCKVYAASDVVPAQFKGNVANCMIAFELAHRLQCNVFMLMQSMYVVQGKPGMEAKLVIALVNMRGPFRGPIKYEIERDDKGQVVSCMAYAQHKATGDKCEATITWDIVEKEGWSKKSGSKWLTMREQMFKYRSAAWLARTYCPEVIMGMHTAEELEDTYAGTRYVESTSTTTGTAALRERLTAPPADAKPTATPIVEATSAAEPMEPQAEAITEQPEASESAGEPAGASNGKGGGSDEEVDITPWVNKGTGQALIRLQSNKHGCTLEEASGSIIRFCKTLYKKEPGDLDAKTIKDLRANIERGDIKV